MIAYKQMLMRATALIALMTTVVSSATIRPAHAADSPFDRSVTALATSGDRILIGQGARLIDARIGTSSTLQVIATRDLNIGAIRSIAVNSDGSAFVLGEAALTVLDANDTAIDVQPMGGQQIVLSGDQVYVAALEAGVRRFQWANDQLITEAGIATGAPAEAIAVQGSDRLWIGEGHGGIWEYNLSGSSPSVIYGDKQINPATLVRAANIAGTVSVIVGYGTHVAILDTQTAKIPRLAAQVDLGGVAVAGEALITADGDLLVGRVAADGADVLRFPLNGLKNSGAAGEMALQPSTQFPVSTTTSGTGGGEHLALAGNTLFYGSMRGGLNQIAISGGQLTAIATWPISAVAACALTDYMPVAPNPAAGALIRPNANGSLTLTWSALCPADHYLVQIGDRPAVAIAQPPYQFQPPAGLGVLRWRVTAQIDQPGLQASSTTSNPIQVSGAPWTAEIAATGLLALPADPDPHAILYQAPLTIGPGFVPQTPMGKLLFVVGLAIGGLIVIVGGAWLIGQLSGRRVRRS